MHKKQGKKAPILHFLHSNRRDLIALINYFGVESREEILQDYDKLSYLDFHSEDIRNHDLGGLYLNTIQKILYRTESVPNLIHLLQKLRQTHVPLIAEEVASEFVHQLLHVGTNPNGDIIAECRKIWTQVAYQLRQKKFRRDTEKGWRRKYLEEWILYFFAGQIVQRSASPATSYSFFKNADWYTSQRDRGFSLAMETEANIAISSLKLKPSFLGFLEELYDTNKLHDQRNCFHIIRHTEQTRGKIAVRVHHKYHDLLRRIYNHSDLQKSLRRFDQFFASNLDLS